MGTRRVALVTGAAKARGIGFAAARKLAAAGYEVALADVTALEGALAERAREIEEEGGGAALAIPCDVTDDASVAHCVDSAIERFGGVHVLFNNAGIGTRRELRDTDMAFFDRMYRVNVRGPIAMTKAVLPHMLERGSGVIVNNASLAGLMGTAGMTHYCATKHAVVGFTRALAGEVGPSGIRVVAVAPGLIDTDIYTEAFEELEIDGEAAMEHAAQSVALRRWGGADEVGDLVAYLASDAASYVNGTVVPIHGGYPADSAL